MENVYVLMAYIAMLIALVGCGLLKLSDILEKKRDEKYYRMIKDDAAFWQMKVEQSGMNVMDWMIEQGTNKTIETIKDFETKLTDKSDEPKEAEEEKEDLFKGLDEWLPF